MGNENTEKTLSYEEAVAQLEQLVRQMESGNLTLQESIQSYEKGISLIKFCESELDKYEKIIEQLGGGKPAEESDGEF